MYLLGFNTTADQEPIIHQKTDALNVLLISEPNT